MESKINYTLVGLFVVLLTAGLITFVYWLGKHGGRQEYDYYLVYMPESVAGLSTDASVKYRGVNVGTVEQLGINSKNIKEVEIRLKIENSTPIKIYTTATLKSFGITGLAFIELSGSSNDAPLLKKTGDSLPIIPATPSTFTKMYTSLEELIQQSNFLLVKFDRRLSEENLENITAILGETKMLVRELRSQVDGLQNFVENGVVMETQVSKAFKKVGNASDSVKKMADSLEQNYADVGQNMQQYVRQSLELLNQLLYDLDILAGDLQHATQAIQASPSDLLLKRSQPKLGPGEKEYNEK